MKKIYCFIIIIILFCFDILLALKLNSERNEKLTWKNKVTLSISQQLLILEHRLEGISLKAEIDFILKNKDLSIPNNSENLILLLYFEQVYCSRCLNREIVLFTNFMKSSIIKPIIVANVTDNEYQSILSQFEIKDFSVQNSSDIFSRRFEYIKNPIVLLLDNNYRVIYANISDLQDELKSTEFYIKIGQYNGTK